jgi:hypothetical protein
MSLTNKQCTSLSLLQNRRRTQYYCSFLDNLGDEVELTQSKLNNAIRRLKRAYSDAIGNLNYETLKNYMLVRSEIQFSCEHFNCCFDDLIFNCIDYIK